MKAMYALFFMVAALFLAVSSVLAGDLVGEWVQVDGWGASKGSGNHYESGTKTKFVPKDINSVNEFTLKITEQSEDGRAFVGEWCSPGNCETVTGAIKSDGTLFFVDSDTFFEGFPNDVGLEVCIMETGPDFQVASCRTMKRK